MGSITHLSEETKEAIWGHYQHSIFFKEGQTIDDVVLENYAGFVMMAGRLPGRSQTKKEKRKGFKHGLIIAMGDNERDYPHFHFFRSEEDKQKWNKVGGCIMMHQATYYIHSGHDDTLNEEEMEALIKFLKSGYRDSPVTKWQQLVNLWNDNNGENYPIPSNTPMPEYHYDMPNYK